MKNVCIFFKTRKILSFILSMSLVIASSPPLCSEGFLAPPIVNEIGQMFLNFSDDLAPSVGSATAAFYLMNALTDDYNKKAKEDVNVMLTNKCPFDCAHCFAKKARFCDRFYDADKNMLFSILRQFRGFKKMHFAGTGEPLAYGKIDLFEDGVSKDLIKIIEYAASCVEELRIVTNAYLVPDDIEDLDKARRFFRQFKARNLVWVVSVDEWHEQQMRDVMGKSLKNIVAILEILAQEGLIKTAYNVRFKDHYKEKEVIKHFGLEEKQKKDPKNVFVNTLLGKDNVAQGNPVNRGDVHLHAMAPQYLFLFIDPYGNVITSDHQAYTPPEERESRFPSIGFDYNLELGNVQKESIAYILFHNLFLSNYGNSFDSFVTRFDLDGEVKTNKVLHTLVDSLVYYLIGDKAKARAYSEIYSQSENAQYYKLQFLYHLYLKIPKQLENIFMSFIRDCFDENPVYTKEYIVKQPLSLLFNAVSQCKNKRQMLEKWLGRIPVPQWIPIEDPLHSPLYYVKGFSHRIDYIRYLDSEDSGRRLTRRYKEKKNDEFSLDDIKNIIFCKISSLAAGKKRYFEEYMRAQLGMGDYPLGFIIDTETSEVFYLRTDYFDNISKDTFKTITFEYQQEESDYSDTIIRLREQYKRDMNSSPNNATRRAVYESRYLADLLGRIISLRNKVCKELSRKLRMDLIVIYHQADNLIATLYLDKKPKKSIRKKTDALFMIRVIESVDAWVKTLLIREFILGDIDPSMNDYEFEQLDHRLNKAIFKAEDYLIFLLKAYPSFAHNAPICCKNELETSL